MSTASLVPDDPAPPAAAAASAQLALMSRRGFLRATALGTVALACGRAVPGALAMGAKPEGFEFLTERDAAVVEAVAATMFAPGGTGAPPPEELGIAAAVDRAFATLDADMRSQLGMLFGAFEYGPYVFGFHLKPFTRLDAEGRAAYLASWETSALEVRRMAFTGLKLLLASCYFADPRTWRFMGYDGPWVGNYELPVYAPQYEA